jgi:exonuclease VII large subunit
MNKIIMCSVLLLVYSGTPTGAKCISTWDKFSKQFDQGRIQDTPNTDMELHLQKVTVLQERLKTVRELVQQSHELCKMSKEDISSIQQELESMAKDNQELNQKMDSMANDNQELHQKMESMAKNNQELHQKMDSMANDLEQVKQRASKTGAPPKPTRVSIWTTIKWASALICVVLALLLWLIMRDPVADHPSRDDTVYDSYSAGSSSQVKRSPSAHDTNCDDTAYKHGNNCGAGSSSQGNLGQCQATTLKNTQCRKKATLTRSDGLCVCVTHMH